MPRVDPHEEWLAVRYRPGDRRGHVESFFLKANEPGGRRAFWIKFTVLAPKGRPEEAVAEVWGVAFHARSGVHLGAKETFAARGAKFGSRPLDLEFGENRLRAGATRGGVRGPSGEVRWDLTFTIDSGPFLLFPSRRLYETRLPRLKSVTPYPLARFSGWVDAGGERVPIAGWPGILGHNWGEHARRYAWMHCNLFDDAPAGTFIEGGSARIGLGPVTSPFLTMLHLQYGDRAYPFNGLRTLLAQASMTHDRYEFEVRAGGATLRGQVAADRNDMVGLLYVNPQGPPIHCLNSKIAKLELRLLRPGEAPVTLRSRAAALELGVREPNHGVRMIA